MKELETLLLEQHYPERITKAGINKVLTLPQNQLRNVREQAKKKILPFISTFNPNNHKALPIIIVIRKRKIVWKHGLYLAEF